MFVIGLMSGTSADGVDSALVDISETGGNKRISLVSFRVYPFPRGVREAILEASAPGTGTVEKICVLNARLGEIFARAAIKITEEASVPIGRVRLIGSHGQTIHHLPDRRCTLQIGEPSVIAEMTGVTTIADFRPRDVAAGGHGAPLTSFLHYHLFRDPKRTRTVQNIGGISNVTVIPAGCRKDKILAFDTGPGNMIIDGLIKMGSGENFDRDGKIAGSGEVDKKLIKKLLLHPYLRKTPPKTTGREEFGGYMLEKIWKEGRKRRLHLKDLVATATAFTARTIVDAYKRFIFPKWHISEIVIGGGGVRNKTLMRMLEEYFAHVRLSTFEDYGLNSDAIEAMAFALLAYEAFRGRANNIPAATGARRAVVMGKIVPGGSVSEGRSQ